MSFSLMTLSTMVQLGDDPNNWGRASDDPAESYPIEKMEGFVFAVITDSHTGVVAFRRYIDDNWGLMARATKLCRSRRKSESQILLTCEWMTFDTFANLRLLWLDEHFPLRHFKSFVKMECCTRTRGFTMRSTTERYAAHFDKLRRFDEKRKQQTNSYIQQVWSISALAQHIGVFKRLFDEALDIDRFYEIEPIRYWLEKTSKFERLRVCIEDHKLMFDEFVSKRGSRGKRRSRDEMDEDDEEDDDELPMFVNMREVIEDLNAGREARVLDTNIRRGCYHGPYVQVDQLDTINSPRGVLSLILKSPECMMWFRPLRNQQFRSDIWYDGVAQSLVPDLDMSDIDREKWNERQLAANESGNDGSSEIIGDGWDIEAHFDSI